VPRDGFAGPFDRVRKEYRGNVVVYAVLTGADPNR
jgi:hypothetical protein